MKPVLGKPREVPETCTTISPKAVSTPVSGPASGFPSQACITSQHAGDPTPGHRSALSAACLGITLELSALRKQNALLQRQIAALTKQVAALQLQQQKPEGPRSATPLVEPAAPELNSPATPNQFTTYPAPPTTAPAAPAVQASPQNHFPIDQTLPLEDRISRLESAVLRHVCH
ncbi:hypothetical protein HPB50_008083 [Hyalomma asiaticum]|uniref:Uncharacterized protein n=1 Tax=Hyalomma asiaticum TaxID=266040 RepID=A0ACB7RTB9_HYAAI|nr:hypothetical protein HPB50_008083 [Hyalomma asiaticum]